MGEAQFYLHDHDRKDSMVDREQLNEAIGLLSNILNSLTVTAVSDTVQQRQQPSTVSSNAAAEEEMCDVTSVVTQELHYPARNASWEPA